MDDATLPSPTQLSRLLRSRFSCRRFADRPVDDATLRALLDDARWAPSGGNLQPWRFVIVRRSRTTAKLAGDAHGQRFLAEAPVVIVVCAVPAESAVRYGARGGELYALQDTAAAVQNLLLSATARGLGTCWVGAFDEASVSRTLDLPAGWRPMAMVPLGYPAEPPGPRTRRRLEEIVVWHPEERR